MTSPTQTNLPIPSAQVARETRKTDKVTMRFLYPLAVACVAVVLLSPQSAQAQGSKKLRPDQERAIELALQEVEPAMRPMARTQLAATFANFNEAQIAMMISKMGENKAAAAAKPKPVVEAPRVATAADLAYNRAQYEPVIRKHHTAQKRFDDFVNARLISYCPKRDEFARFGAGWRYEQGQYVEPSALATWNVDSDVEIAAEAYAPKDGRYTFDFSKVRMTFDEKAVDAAIKTACDQVKVRGKEFLAKVDPLIAAKNWDGAFKAETMAGAAMSPIREEMQAKFNKLSPGDFTEIQLAMMNGKRTK